MKSAEETVKTKGGGKEERGRKRVEGAEVE